MGKLFITIILLLGLMPAILAKEPPKRIGLNITKTGLLIGLQQGRYNGFELGMERQWKQLKFKQPRTIAANFNMEYLTEAQSIGFKTGLWYRPGRLDFTYGAHIIYSTDFQNDRLGFTPSIGFKLAGFHFNAGYNILPNNSEFKEYNKLHVSARYFISRKREIDVVRRD